MVKIECVGWLPLCPFNSTNDINYQYSLSLEGYNPDTDFLKIETGNSCYIMASNKYRITVYTKHPTSKITCSFRRGGTVSVGEILIT